MIPQLASHARLSVSLFALVACVVAGCDNDVTCTDGDGDGEGGEGGSGGGVIGVGGGEPTGEWSSLITADWSLEPFSEITSDIHTITLDRDVYVGAIRPIAPEGTHHTLLALGNFDVGNVIYASGVGTNPVVFPEGVGLKLLAGQTIVLQLHLFNPQEAPLDGVSGIEIIEVAPEDVEQEADLLLPGPFGFSIPPNQEYSHSGTCTVNQQQTVFALFPHMHQLGTDFKTTLSVNGTETVLHEGPYSFDHQAFISFDPITLNPGDSIKTDCTWNNTTANNVGWGESSTTEMCFSILYRYPAIEGDSFCN